MKKITILLLVLISVNFLSNAQSEEDHVKKIREMFASVNSNLKTFKIVEKDIEDESTEGGIMKAYYDKDQLVLLHCEFYGETGNFKEDYYYNEDKLFFVFSVVSNYSAPIYSEEEIKVSVEENRYYFAGDKIIRYLDKDKKKVDKNSEEFTETGDKVFKESKRLIDKFINN